MSERTAFKKLDQDQGRENKLAQRIATGLALLALTTYSGDHTRAYTPGTDNEKITEITNPVEVLTKDAVEFANGVVAKLPNRPLAPVEFVGDEPGHYHAWGIQSPTADQLTEEGPVEGDSQRSVVTTTFNQKEKTIKIGGWVEKPGNVSAQSLDVTFVLTPDNPILKGDDVLMTDEIATALSGSEYNLKEYSLTDTDASVKTTVEVQNGIVVTQDDANEKIKLPASDPMSKVNISEAVHSTTAVEKAILEQ